METAECPETDNGQHFIEWVTVPSQTYNGREVYPDHKRGVCYACGELFRQL